MDKSKIKDYLKMVDDLETRLTGEDRETLAWLIYGYNQCAKLLNETEQQVKKQKEVIEEIKKELLERNILDLLPFDVAEKLCYLLKEVSE